MHNLEECDLTTMAISKDTLSCVALTTVKVVVVLQKLEDQQKYGSLEEQQKKDFIKNLLRKSPVKKGCIVSSNNRFLRSLCGIHSVCVYDTISEEKSSFGVVTRKTSIEILKITSCEEEAVKEKFNKTSFLSDELKSLLESVMEKRDHLRSFLLWGLPGCDKNAIVVYMALKSNAFIININFHLHQVGPCDPEKKLEEIIANAVNAAQNKLCMVCIEELDKFCHFAGPRVLARLETLKDLEYSIVGNLILCATADRLSDVDQNWRRTLFKRQILVEAPKRATRLKILRSLLAEVKCVNDLNLESVAAITAGETEADMTTLVALALQNQSQEKDQLSQEDFETALCSDRFTLKHTDLFLSTKPVGWNEIGGHDSIKAQLLQATVWPLTYPEVFLRLGEYPPKGILLTGPPGCGKTTLVRAMTSSNNINFLSATAAQLYSPYVGESEKKMAALMQQAKACAPSVVFIDELDSVVGSRSMSSCGGGNEGGSGIHERVLSTLLNSLDGIGSRVMDIQRISKRIEVEVDGRQILRTTFC